MPMGSRFRRWARYIGAVSLVVDIAWKAKPRCNSRGFALFEPRPPRFVRWKTQCPGESIAGALPPPVSRPQKTKKEVLQSWHIQGRTPPPKTGRKPQLLHRPSLPGVLIDLSADSAERANSTLTVPERDVTALTTPEESSSGPPEAWTTT